MRILYVSDYAPNPGGAGSFLRDQMEAQRRLGHEVAVCCDHVPEHYRLFRPDVIHFHTVIVNTGLAVLEWAQWQRIPHCLTLHDFWPFCANRMMLRSIGDEAAGVMCPTCDGQCDGGKQHPRVAEIVNATPTLANQGYQAKRLRDNGVRVDEIIPCGLDTEFWTPPIARPTDVRIVSTSAWGGCHWKGWGLTSRAFANTGHTVHLVGGLPQQSVRDVLQSAHIFLFPSSYPETWGLSLLEAMACGCACVASAVDGPRVMIEDGVDGLLVPPRDEAALRDATLALVGNRERRERLGQAAAKKVRERWTLRHLGENYQAFYRKLLDREVA